jgi:regulator of CtrA degradation
VEKAMMEGQGPVAFFSRTYDETLGLLSETRDYITRQQPRECLTIGPADRIAVMQETTRLVARLTQVMAWLMVRKAVAVGEMSREQSLRTEHRLSGQSVCLAEADAPPLPQSRLPELLDRSRRLYIRVNRLDELLGRDAI